MLTGNKVLSLQPFWRTLSKDVPPFPLINGRNREPAALLSSNIIPAALCKSQVRKRRSLYLYLMPIPSFPPLLVPGLSCSTKPAQARASLEQGEDMKSLFVDIQLVNQLSTSHKSCPLNQQAYARPHVN